MLVSLEIKNFVLIDKLKIKFDKGFNVLTGETGAGKSIIISALELITGEKGSTRSVGLNGDKLLVIGTFDISSSKKLIKEKLAEWNIELNSRELTIKREISKDGKSRSFINFTGVRVSELKELGDLLIDIHGQHEHQSLFNPANHLAYYDSFVKNTTLLHKYQESYNKLTKLVRQHNDIIKNKNSILKEQSFLTYAVEEIEKAKLKNNEDEDIKTDIAMMSNAEKIDNALSNVAKDIYGNESGAYIKLSRSIANIEAMSEYDPRLEEVASQIEGVTLTLEEIKSILMDVRQKTKYNPKHLEELNERLFFINSLKKKYGTNIKEIISYAKEAREKLEAIQFSDEDIEQLKTDIEATKKEASALALELSNLRASVKDKFVHAIESDMADLGMASTKFDVEINKEEDENGIIEIDNIKYKATPNGIDNMEFIIAPNKQAVFQPLRKIASGGEISRIMLSLKNTLSSGEFVNACVFDEIDVGVGGAVAEAIGQKIANLSKEKQVLVVTHLAQIAVFAKNHFKVFKNEDAEIVTSSIELLDKKERTLEIARMIAGKEITEASIKHAEDMINNIKL